MNEIYWDIVIIQGLAFCIFDYFITIFGKRRFGWLTIVGGNIANFLLNLIGRLLFPVSGVKSVMMAILVYYLIVMIGYKVKKAKGLLVTMGIFTVTNLSDCIIFLLWSTKGFDYPDLNNMNIRLLENLSLYVMYFLVILMVKRIKNKIIDKKKLFKKIDKMYILYLTVILVWIITTYWFIVWSFVDTNYIRNEVGIIWVGFIAAYMLLFFSTMMLLRIHIKRISKINMMSESMDMQNNQLGSLYNQYVFANELKETYVKNVEDIKNALDRSEDLRGFFDEGVRTDRKYKINICINMSVNAVIHNKQAECRKKGIEFDCNAEGYIETRVTDIDLCSIVFNLIDNGIEACELNKSNYIKFRLYSRKGHLVMMTENYYGEINKKHKKKGDHGIGTRIIKSIVEKYEGSDVVDISDNKYVHIVTIKNE